MRVDAFLLTFPVNFRLSRFRIIYSHHLVISVKDDELSGTGSGVLYRGTGADVTRAWQGWLHEWLLSSSWNDLLASRMSLLERAIETDPGLAFALDSALWDMQGKHSGESVSQLVGDRHREAIDITEQIFINDWRKSRKELDQILDRGTRRLKIKTGFSLEQDIELLKRVRNYVGDEVEIRLDANRAYSYEDSVAFYQRAVDFGVLAVEEPIRFSHMEELARFRNEVGLPVMLDETILTIDDLKQAIAAEAIDSLNIKLTRVGGLSQALVYRRLCQEARVSVSIGCNEDLGPGMASILHLAAATPDLYSTEGVGHIRLGTDIIQDSMVIEDGRVQVPKGPGLGIQLHSKFRQQLEGRARVFDLSTVSLRNIKTTSAYYRQRQRAASAVFRLSRMMRR